MMEILSMESVYEVSEALRSDGWEELTCDDRKEGLKCFIYSKFIKDKEICISYAYPVFDEAYVCNDLGMIDSLDELNDFIGNNTDDVFECDNPSLLYCGWVKYNHDSKTSAVRYMKISQFVKLKDGLATRLLNNINKIKDNKFVSKRPN